MAQINRTGTGRVLGTSIGRLSSGSTRTSSLGMTPEQIEQRDKDTQASYEAWRKAREARKAERYRAMRSRNMGL